jgi:hypothetical protein
VILIYFWFFINIETIKEGGDMKAKAIPVTVKREQIIRRVNFLKKLPTKSNLIGRIREDVVEKILIEMVKNKEIKSYLKTSSSYTSTFADIFEGIDFYIIKVAETGYKVFKISVTGPRWVAERIKYHPEVPVVVVDLKNHNIFSNVEEQIRRILSTH